MDSLALLCNLHADGPESLRRLRRAGVADLRSLFALGVEGVEPLLGRGRPAAQRFLKEARLLEQRQLLSDAEDATAAPQRPGGPGQAPARERWPSAGNAATPPGWSAAGTPRSAAPLQDLSAADAALGGVSSHNPIPRVGAEWPAPVASAHPLPSSDWVARHDERLGLAATSDLSGPDEGLGDYVLAPTPPGREPVGEGGPSEPRHSVLSALLAAWSRGNGPEEGEPVRPGPGRGLPAGTAPAVRPPEGAARVEAAGLAPSVPVSGDAPVHFTAAPPAPLRSAKGVGAVDSWLGGSGSQPAASHGQAAPGWPTPAPAAETGNDGVARLSRGSPWAPGGLSSSPLSNQGSGIRGEGQTIDLDAFLNARAEPGAGQRIASAPWPQTPRGAPLAWLINEQIDPAALAALERQGLTTLEQVLAGDPRDLSRQAGLSYTLVLRLQYLARRTLNERGA